MNGKVAIRRKLRPANGAGSGLELMDRIGTLLVLLLIGSIAATVLMISSGVLGPGHLPALFPGDPAEQLQALAPSQRLAIAIGAVVVGIGVSMLLLGSRSRGHRKEQAARGVHVVDRNDRGLVLVSGSGVDTVARAAAVRVPGVLDAEIRSRGSGSSSTSLRVRAWVLAGSNARQAGEEMRSGVAEAVERLVGIEVGTVNVEMQIVEPEDESWLLR